MPVAPVALLPAARLAHERVFRLIADQIREGLLGPGDRLPSERALEQRLGVSRTTVRRALRDLVDAGLIESAHGRGTYIAAAAAGVAGAADGPRIGESPDRLMSFTELGAARGLVARARVLRTRSRPSTLDEAERFGTAPGAPLFELQRLRLLDGHPLAVDRSRLPLAVAPRLAELDWTSASVYATLAAAGSAPIRADYAVEAAAADERLAELLEVAVGSPILLAFTTVFRADGRLVELAETNYRGDRYRFRATLTRRT